MMSREFLTRIGIMAIALGLTAAPLAFADSQEKEEMNGEHGQSEHTTTQDTATDSDETATTGSDTTTDSNDAATDSSGMTTDSSDTATDSEQTEAGGAGIEAQDGTQAGEEPNPEEEAETQTQ